MLNLPLFFITELKHLEQNHLHTQIAKKDDFRASASMPRRKKHYDPYVCGGQQVFQQSPTTHIFFSFFYPHTSNHPFSIASLPVMFSPVTSSPRSNAPMKTPKKPPKTTINAPLPERKRWPWQIADKSVSQYRVEEMLKQLGMEPEDWTRLQRDV
jgi:hypothetical protein